MNRTLFCTVMALLCAACAENGAGPGQHRIDFSGSWRGLINSDSLLLEITEVSADSLVGSLSLTFGPRYQATKRYPIVSGRMPTPDSLHINLECRPDLFCAWHYLSARATDDTTLCGVYLHRLENDFRMPSPFCAYRQGD